MICRVRIDIRKRMLVLLSVGCMVAMTAGKGLPSNHLPLQGHQIWKLAKAPQDVLQTLEIYGLVDILDHSTTSTISVAPHHMDDVSRILQENKVDIDVAVQDLAKFIEEREAEDLAEQQRKRSNSNRAKKCTASNCKSPLTNDWMTFQQMEYYLKHISSAFPDRVTLTSIGKSVENRDMWMVHIKSGGCNPSRKERMAKSIWLEGGIHSREWISPSVVLQMIDRFITECENTKLYDVYAVPNANPDGYEYSRLTNRMQRKNRARNSGASCQGVDLNRNWGYKWGVAGTSSNPCSAVYKGKSAFSEPETKALSDAMIEIKDLELYLSFHSYGQALYLPWGWTTSKTVPDKEALERMADVFITHTKVKHGTFFYQTNSATGYYPTMGCSDDWAKGGLGVKYSYTVELRDRGNYGFQLPRNQILPSGQEVWDGLKMMLAAINDDPVPKKVPVPIPSTDYRFSCHADADSGTDTPVQSTFTHLKNPFF